MPKLAAEISCLSSYISIDARNVCLAGSLGPYTSNRCTILQYCVVQTEEGNASASSAAGICKTVTSATRAGKKQRCESNPNHLPDRGPLMPALNLESKNFGGFLQAPCPDFSTFEAIEVCLKQPKTKNPVSSLRTCVLAASCFKAGYS